MHSLSAGDLAPDDRFRELASMLAMGVMRQRQRLARATMARAEDFAGISPARLEVSPDTVLSVTNPVNDPESPTLGAPA